MGATRFALAFTGGVLASGTVYSVLRTQLNRDVHHVRASLQELQRQLERDTLPGFTAFENLNPHMNAPSRSSLLLPPIVVRCYHQQQDILSLAWSNLKLDWNMGVQWMAKGLNRFV